VRMQDKVALITGAANGLGRKIAETFASEGARLVLADVARERLEDLVATLDARGPGCVAVCADVTREDDAREIVARAVAEFGRLDCAVNNAGIMDGMQLVDEADPALYRKVMAVNADGPFLVSQAAVRQMLAQDPPGGAIVNIASLAGAGGMRGGTPYTMSKHAVIGLTRSTAFSYRHRGIRCNAVLPGTMATDMGGDFDPERYSAQALQLLTEGFQRPDTMLTVDTQQVANMVTYLASDDARDVNGAEIVVDGGGASY
jgi:NAD(P)-dependent dehydrogenase (short-subunit alcohol dehydrogenase family)